MWIGWLVAVCVWSSLRPAWVAAQAAAPDARETQWFVGAYYRHAWVPKALLKPFFERAAGLSNDGFGLTASRVVRGGVTTELGVGYMPYAFRGAFNAGGAPLEDTEYVTSKLGLLHLTGSLLWPIELQRMLTLELGVGVDFGIITGNLRRSEAYSDARGTFRACSSALHPATLGPGTDPVPYCDQAYDRNGKPIASNAANVMGEQYGAKETRVPPILLVPMLPHVALRFTPLDRLAVKLEAAFGLAQFWVGASVHVRLGSERAEPPSIAAPPVHAGVFGRVVGKLMEHGTQLPIAHASVKAKPVFSAIQTEGKGLFVFERIPSGSLHLQISHPGYEAGSCEVTVPETGADTFVHCFLRARPKDGAISGRVKDVADQPIPDARIVITGPARIERQSDADGLFAVPEAPAGIYRVRVQAAGFVVQEIELEVLAHEIAIPQIILLKPMEKP